MVAAHRIDVIQLSRGVLAPLAGLWGPTHRVRSEPDHMCGNTVLTDAVGPALGGGGAA